MSTIILTENLQTNVVENKTKSLVKALNYYICNMPIKGVLNYVGEEYKCDNVVNLCISPNIFVDVCKKDEKTTEYRISSPEYDLVRLKMFLNDILMKYNYEDTNKFGLDRYYFDEKQVHLLRNMDGTIRTDSILPHLEFTKTKFCSNKNFTNIFGDHLDVVKKRLELFKNKEWYIKTGQPNNLGCFYGVIQVLEKHH
jgi:hypothetical protein